MESVAGDVWLLAGRTKAGATGRWAGGRDPAWPLARPPSAACKPRLIAESESSALSPLGARSPTVPAAQAAQAPRHRMLPPNGHGQAQAQLAGGGGRVCAPPTLLPGRRAHLGVSRLGRRGPGSTSSS